MHKGGVVWCVMLSGRQGGVSRGIYVVKVHISMDWVTRKVMLLPKSIIILLREYVLTVHVYMALYVCIRM